MKLSKSLKTKSFRMVMALALAVMLCLGSMPSVFAAGDPITGTESDPAKAAITKNLQMPEGTTTPAATFIFKITAKTVDGVTATTTNMPAIADKTVTFAATDAGTTTGDVKSVKKETTDDIFKGVTWPHAGEYTYTITEQSGTYTTAAGETMTYSGGSYDVTVYVANGTSGLYVAAIGAKIVVTDNPGQTGGDKVDPTPGGDPLVTGDSSKLIFTNTYIKTIVDPRDPTDPTDPGDPDDPTNPDNQGISISKTVAGNYGDKTKGFTFNVTVTKNSLVTAHTYTAYLMEGNTVVTDSSANPISYTFTPGTAQEVTLTDGQRLVCIGVEVGTRYVAVESAATGYTPSMSIVTAGGTPVVTGGTVSTLLSTGSQLAGDGANSADFTNTYNDVTPTGIIINNLPFILMIVLAAGAFVAFVVVKSRKRASGSSH